MLVPLSTTHLPTPLGQVRAAPVRRAGTDPVLGDAALALLYGPDFDIDPSPHMFFLPTGPLRLALADPAGTLAWEHVFEPTVLAGVWFTPLLPYDLDGDGEDELFMIRQTSRSHPLDPDAVVIEARHPRDGQVLGRWPWPNFMGDCPMYMMHRHFLAGGRVRRSAPAGAAGPATEPVLVAAQGTYARMVLRGYGPGMIQRWEHVIEQPDRGARGSHMCPVVDLDGDGSDELLWGERCIRLDDGSEMFCADRETYRGHSDIVQPVRDRQTGEWRFFCCRESHPAATPRVACYDRTGQRLWGDLEAGHMDMGFVAYLRTAEGERHVAAAIRIGAKQCGPDGRTHQDREEFVYDLRTGRRTAWPQPVYRCLPVDLSGSGVHGLVRGLPGGDGQVFAPDGTPTGDSCGGPVAMASRFRAHAGEQLLSWSPDGQLTVWADDHAADTPAALARYAHPAYAANQRLTACGYNLVNLGGV